MNIELLERLCTACGVSGDEDDIRDIILEEIKPYADELKVDSLGNILAFKKGKQRAKSKLLISAHMDEVGFIVTNIESNGTLKFAEVGGIDKKAACGKAVLIGKNKLPGVIGAVPVHVLKADERAKNPSIDSLYIDIGADTKEQAEKCVSLGDCVYFDSVFEADERIIGHGGGAASQHTYCSSISWEEALPGDLVFYPGNTHVGIFVGTDSNGNPLIIHCASSQNTVVLTGLQGFTMIGRPDIFRMYT